MTFVLRLVLILSSIVNCIWILSRIRNSQMKIEDSVFWILFSFSLVTMGLFPGLVEFGAKLSGVQSPVNFVFLSIIFILILKMFRMSMKISRVENKLQTFAQTYAIHRKEDADKLQFDHEKIC